MKNKSEKSSMDFYNPQSTLNQWRIRLLEFLERNEKEKIESLPQWPDFESQEAENFLKIRGIEFPWSYGDTFGKDHRVVGLRAGGIGIVVIVESEKLGVKRRYAAKTLISFFRPDYLDLPGWQQEQISNAFLEEALSWLEMGQHPHIVPVMLLENIVHPKLKINIPFIFSQFMPKGSLKRYLEAKGSLDLGEALLLGVQLCDGLNHAYKHGLSCHLDLKPDNIMVYDKGIFKVTDFSANVIGTPGYMAPEQVIKYWQSRWEVKITFSKFPLDHRADQFAVALLILEALSGKHPFPICFEACNNRDKAKEYVEEGVKDVPVNISSELKDILLQALSPDPNNRFTDILSFKKHLIKAYEKRFGRYQTPEVEIDDSVEWWINRGNAFAILGRLTKAEEIFNKAFKKIDTEKDPYIKTISTSICWMNIGEVFRRLSKFAQAEEAFKKAVSKFQEIPGTELEQAECLNNLGVLFRQTSRFEEAEQYFLEALKIYASLKRKFEQAMCMNNLGNLYRDKGELSKAKQFYEDALFIFNSIHGSEYEKGLCMMNIATIYSMSGEFDESKKIYQNALQIFQAIPGKEFNIAQCLVGLGNIYLETGDLKKAEEMYIKALNIFSFQESSLEKAQTLVNLGMTYWLKEESKKAEEFYKEALELYKCIPKTELYQARCMQHLGEMYAEDNNWEKAREQFIAALKIFQNIPNTALFQAICKERLGRVFANLREFSKAEEMYKEALKIFASFDHIVREQIDCLTNLGLLYFHQNDFKKAYQCAKDALILSKNFPPETTLQIRFICNQILKFCEMHKK